MKSLIYSLYARYRSHHDMKRSFLEWVGVVGVVAFPLFYLLRFTGRLPPRYDDLELRIIATLLCLGLALRRWWPARIQPFYLAYSYLGVFFCLSFMLTFTTLKNQGDGFSFVNMMIGTVFVILLADWRNAAVILLSGYATGLGAFLALQPGVGFASDFLVWVPAPTVIFVAVVLSQMGKKQADAERDRLYLALAGSIAHEMRNPMQKIQNVFDTLEREFFHAYRSHRPEQIKALVRLVGEGRCAMKLGLQSITLTLKKLRAKELDVSCFTCLSAVACTRRAVNEFSYESPEQRERVRVKEVADFTFKGDETILVLVLFNLIKNALYYLPAYPGAKVTVMVDGQRITVRDTGPGIAPGRLANLFEDFQTSGKAEGTGLGLAFCRRAMRAFGGEISCTSRLGEFTQFTLSFPKLMTAGVCEHIGASMRGPEDQPVRDRAETPKRFAGRSVMLADDSSVNRAIVRSYLEELGMEVMEAKQGLDVLRLLRAGAQPAVILMDLEMPVLDGMETTRQLRSLDGVPGNMPVIALTGHSSREDRDAALAAGMDGFISKPVSVRALSDEMGRVFAARGDG